MVECFDKYLYEDLLMFQCVLSEFIVTLLWFLVHLKFDPLLLVTLCTTYCRYVSSELATDVIINVGDVKFFLHKVTFS